MASNTLLKYTADVRNFQMDFSQMDEIVGGDTITSVSSVTCSPSGVTVGTPSVVSGNKKIQFQLSSGTAGTTYDIVGVVVTAGGFTLVGVGTLSVIST